MHYETVKLENHLSLGETLNKLRYMLTETERMESLALLEKAVSKAQENPCYAREMAEAMLCGSTVELRELLSAFGDYFEPPRSEFPFYPHHDAVNGIDSAMGAIKFDQLRPGAMQERITFIKLMRS